MVLWREILKSDGGHGITDRNWSSSIDISADMMNGHHSNVSFSLKYLLHEVQSRTSTVGTS